MDPMPYILPNTDFYGRVRLVRPSMTLYDLMSYLIPFYNLLLLASPYVCLILTPWMSDSQHTHVVPLCLLVSGTKCSHTFLLNLTFFDFFNILFIGINTMIRSLNLLKRPPCVGLVMKSAIMSFLGHNSAFNSFLLIWSVMKNK